MDTFTRGSWEIQPRSDTRDAVRVVVRQGFLEREICQVATPDGEREGHSNALLIAAAPDLLAACREAVSYLRQVADHPRLEQQLQDAINMAERGRS